VLWLRALRRRVKKMQKKTKRKKAQRVMIRLRKSERAILIEAKFWMSWKVGDVVYQR
jgi:hypothetical protein